MKKVLVTGGTGFIGSRLVSYLLSKSIKVIVIDKSILKPTYFDISKAEIIEGDVLSQGLLRECLKRVDTCFHLAAILSLTVCARDWIFSHENNVLAFNGLLEELRRAAHPVKLVYASSCAVYGDSQDLPSSELHRVNPISSYGADKLSNEIYAEVVAKSYGVNAIGLRLFNVYGPGQLDSNSYAGVITSFKNAIDKGQPIRIFGDGNQTRDFIYLEDVVEGFVAVANNKSIKSGIYNICNGNPISILDLAELMMKLSGKRVSIIHENARPGDPYHSLGDSSLAKEKFGFCAKISMESGLKNLFTINKGHS
ncbi:MAG: NAD-dependent epimerase/dehydratase family protein [Tatlockia sp.]|nr:NAD-dependent epimerase/dehydratase family protein [Tatlockia sp.]